MLNFLLDHELLASQEELRALIKNDVNSFKDLLIAADKEPAVLKPVLSRYIDWFNRERAPIAVEIATA